MAEPKALLSLEVQAADAFGSPGPPGPLRRRPVLATASSESWLPNAMV